MELNKNIDADTNKISLNHANKIISDIEKTNLNLRLIETKYLSDSINNMKVRHRKVIWSTLLISFIGALGGGVLYCQFIHCALKKAG